LGVVVPEGPEVFTMSRQVAEHLGAVFISCSRLHDVCNPNLWGINILKSIDHFDVSTPVLRENLKELAGRQITAIRHVAKMTVFQLDLTDGGSSRYVYVSYGMTGSWSLQPTAHSRVVFTFDKAPPLYFNDPRKFGRVGHRDYFNRISNVGEYSIFHPLYAKEEEGSFTPDAVLPKLVKRFGKRGVRWFFNDPYIAPGVGNYIVNEALWWSRIHPEVVVNTLSELELLTIVASLRQVYRESVAAGGMSMSDYVGLDGKLGSFQSQLKCYRVKSCSRCGSDIRRKADGDSSFYHCPVCQPSPNRTVK
jgi:formamidopyrimidine-DNA glycosylase